MLPEPDFLRIAVEEGISFDPGSSFRADASATPLAFRLCFSRAKPSELIEGVKRLVRAWRRFGGGCNVAGEARPGTQ
jgi:DNA-binding transcriptional MocR family regulator